MKPVPPTRFDNVIILPNVEFLKIRESLNLVCMFSYTVFDVVNAMLATTVAPSPCIRTASPSTNPCSGPDANWCATEEVAFDVTRAFINVLQIPPLPYAASLNAGENAVSVSITPLLVTDATRLL